MIFLQYPLPKTQIEATSSISFIHLINSSILFFLQLSIIVWRLFSFQSQFDGNHKKEFNNSACISVTLICLASFN